MSAFLDFSAQPHWDPQALAGAVPIRLRLHQLFAFDAKSAAQIHDSANRTSTPRPGTQESSFDAPASVPDSVRGRPDSVRSMNGFPLGPTSRPSTICAPSGMSTTNTPA